MTYHIPRIHDNASSQRNVFQCKLVVQWSLLIVTVLGRQKNRYYKVDSRSTLRRGTIHVRYAMERGSPGTTLWFLMDSLMSAIRYALERRIPRTTLCGTWKLEHYVIHFVFLFMIGDHSLL